MPTGDQFKKVRPGDELQFPAAVYNSVIDVLRDRSRRSSSGSIVADYDPSVVLIRNDTGDDQERSAVLGISGVVLDPTDQPDGFKERIALIGRVPSLPDDEGSFAVLLEPIADGAMGYGVISGGVPVQLNVVSESDTFAEAADGDVDKLTTSTSGSARILWKPTGTGTKWGVVRLGNLSSGGTALRFLQAQINLDYTPGFYDVVGELTRGDPGDIDPTTDLGLFGGVVGAAPATGTDDPPLLINAAEFLTDGAPAENGVALRNLQIYAARYYYTNSDGRVVFICWGTGYDDCNTGG